MRTSLLDFTNGVTADSIFPATNTHIIADLLAEWKGVNGNVKETGGNSSEIYYLPG